MTAMMPEKGIDGITPDNDFINKLLSPEVKVDGTSKKGPAKAFLVQLSHKAETRCERGDTRLGNVYLLALGVVHNPMASTTADSSYRKLPLLLNVLMAAYQQLNRIESGHGANLVIGCPQECPRCPSEGPASR